MNTVISSPEQEAREYLPRYRYFYLLIALASVVVSGRLWYLQIVQGSELRAFSERNRIKETKMPAPRGIMFDRDGRELVQNLPGFAAHISPQYAQDINLTAETMSQALGIPKEKITNTIKRSRVRNGPYRPVKIKDNLSLEEVFKLKLSRLDHPGLNIDETIVRNYPLGVNGAQLFGYVGEISRRQIQMLNQKYRGRLTFDQGDTIGKGGLEEAHEGSIRGKDGVAFLQVDARGRETRSDTTNLLGEVFKTQEAVPGLNLVLTLDKDIQEAAFKSFEKNQRIGAVVAMKTNGEILAWVSTPSYDPNQFSTGITTELWSKLRNDAFKPLMNKVIQDHVPPGSAFKPIVALAGLGEKVVTESTVWHCPGMMRFGNRPYHDSKREGHGYLNIMEALERSSNIFFFKLGIALGIDKIAEYASALGIGQKTGIDLQQEVSGLMPTSRWKKETYGEDWQPGENLSNAIGQGFVLATPLQMAIAYSGIATKGKIYRPFVVKKIVRSDGRVIQENQPQLLRDLTDKTEGRIQIAEETFEVVRKGLYKVNNGGWGTGRGLQKIPGVEVAGKTGTSQVIGFSADQIYKSCENRPIHQRHHGWYIGYAPADNPEVVVSVLAEHSCHGSSGAGPTARDVIEAYMTKYRPDLIEKGRMQLARRIPPTPKPRQDDEED